MNSPEDEIPLPSDGVLSEEESARQINAAMVRPYTERIKALESKLAETDKAYSTVKDWAHLVSSQLETLLDRCCDHADGSPDASPLDKFCNEMIGLSNAISFKEVQTLRFERDALRRQIAAQQGQGRRSDTEIIDALQSLPFQLDIVYKVGQPKSGSVPPLRDQINHFLDSATSPL